MVGGAGIAPGRSLWRGTLSECYVEVMMMSRCCGSCLVGRFGGTCPGVGFVFTYCLAYAAGYGLRSYDGRRRDEECWSYCGGG